MKKYLLVILFIFSSAFLSAQLPTNVNVISENITFESNGTTLKGTFLKPKKYHAVVVLVHGSGQEKRMLKLATSLAENGIAVLTYDKRGVGESGGVYVGPEVGTNNIDSANLNLLALDASEAVNALSAKLRIKNRSVGLLGFSQAGWIIPIATATNPKVKFVVLFSGPLVNTLEQLRFQFYTAGDSKFWDKHTELEASAHTLNDPDKYQFKATDPREALATTSVKGLWIFGGKDIQIPVAMSVKRLEELNAKGKYFDYKLYPELGHNTAFSKSDEPLSYVLQWIKNLPEK